MRAALQTAERTDDVHVVALVDGAPRPPGRLRLPRDVAADLGRRILEPGAAAPGVRRELPVTSLGTLARRHRVELVAPPGGVVNAPEFVRRVEDELRPDGSLTLMLGQIFGEDLLAACRRPANFHDALLPAYRGVGATSWSVYAGEARSGFTFHLKTADVDDGPVLLQDAVTVAPRAVSGQVARAKTRLAARRMGDALDRLVGGDPGRPQRGEASMFTRADRQAIARIEDPSALTWDDLQRRLRAFELLTMGLGGREWPVTSLRQREGRARRAALAFTTADGVRGEPSRFVHLPWPLFRAYRLVG